MAHVVVVGGGPAGLSAALFAASEGVATTLFDRTDDPSTLAPSDAGPPVAPGQSGPSNYLGLPETDGETFRRVAREQVNAAGVDRRRERILEVEADGEEFVVVTDEGPCAADALVLATERARDLVDQLRCERNEDGTVAVDRNGRTTVPGVYAVGRAARGDRTRTAVSVGDGAAAALDLLARFAGGPSFPAGTTEWTDGR